MNYMAIDNFSENNLQLQQGSCQAPEGNVDGADNRSQRLIAHEALIRAPVSTRIPCRERVRTDLTSEIQGISSSATTAPNTCDTATAWTSPACSAKSGADVVVNVVHCTDEVVWRCTIFLRIQI